MTEHLKALRCPLARAAAAGVSSAAVLNYIAAAYFVTGCTALAAAGQLPASAVLPFWVSSTRLLLSSAGTRMLGVSTTGLVVPPPDLDTASWRDAAPAGAVLTLINLAAQRCPDAWPQLAVDELPPEQLALLLASSVALQQNVVQYQRRGELCQPC